MKELAIVTGGTRGIGRAIVEKLLHNGYRVFFTYQKSDEACKDIVKLFPKDAQGFKVDSADWVNIQNFSKEVLEISTPSVLVNNVGINQDHLFFEQDLNDFWNIIQINLGSMLCFSKCFLSAMMERREGHIVNISSIASKKPKIGNSAYGISKASIERFSQSLALEVARFNIHVNCVSPGFVDTDMVRQFLEKGNKKEFYSQIPMRKILTPENVSDIVLLICQNRIATTGSNFYIGNGENII